MKTAIIQKNNQNNQINQKIPIPQLKIKAIQEIKVLLRKYPSVKGENLLLNQDWEKKIKSLTTQQEILNLARQLREAVIQQSRQQQRNSSPSNNSSNNFPSAFVAVLIGSGALLLTVSVLVIRYWKIQQKKKRYRQKIN